MRFLLSLIVVALVLASPLHALRAESKSLYLQAMEELDAGNTAKALELFNRLQKTDPKRALTGKLDLYKRSGDNQKVIETADELAALVPNSKRLRVEKAIALYNLGGWEKAESLLQGIESEIEGDPKLFVEYGRYLLFKGDFEAAQKVFERTLELDPNSEKAKIGLAYCHVWREEDEEAQKLVDQVLAKNPNSLDGLILQGWILAWNQKYAEAAAVFQKADQIRPNHPEVTRGLAQTYNWDGQYDRSIRYYQADLALQPGNADIMLELGRVYEANGQYGDAIDILSQAASEHPDRTDIQQELALAQKWASYVDQNIKNARKRIDLTRGDTRDYLSLGQAFRWGGQVNRSKKIYEEALKKTPDDAALLYGYAQILEEKNDLEGARKNYTRVLELKPNFMDAELALRRIKLAFRPSIMVQYDFIRSDLKHANFFDTHDVIQEHRATIEYGQRLHSMYTLRAGYTFDPIHDSDKDNQTTNLSLLHHQFYLQNELNLPHSVNAVLRYDFHDYSNRGANDFDLSGNKIEHGGYALVSKQVPHNLLAFEFSRQFFQFASPDGTAAIGTDHTLTASDDLSFGPYFSSQLSFSGLHDSVASAWTRTYTLHPRLVLPFFPPATVEYQGDFTDSPFTSEHSGIVKLVGQAFGTLQVEGRYALTYFTFSNDIGHNAQVFLTWDPIERLNLTVTGELEFHAGDFIQNYLLSITTFL
ncbi:MAG TPA: tetratricopeptide repeat protein [bacterium]|nr:tetratricopeptide repeat protein [bacterium]